MNCNDVHTRRPIFPCTRKCTRFLSICGGSCGFVPCTRPVFNYVWRVMAGHGVWGLTPSLSANHVDNQRFANDVHGFVHENAQFHPILGVFLSFRVILPCTCTPSTKIPAPGKVTRHGENHCTIRGMAATMTEQRYAII